MFKKKSSKNIPDNNQHIQFYIYLPLEKLKMFNNKRDKKMKIPGM